MRNFPLPDGKAAVTLLLLAAISVPVCVLGQEPDAAAGKKVPVPGTAVPASSYQPPSAKDRFRQYLQDLYGPSAPIKAGVMAGIDQFRRDPPEWKQGGTGFAKRFGSKLGESAIEETARYALASTLHEDTRYYRCTCAGVLPRLGHALLSGVTARATDGHRVVSIPDLVAPYAGGLAAAGAWYPDRFGPKDGIRRGTISLGIRAGVSVVHEFLRVRK